MLNVFKKYDFYLQIDIFIRYLFNFYYMSISSGKISLFYCANNINSSELLKSFESNQKFSVNPISLACSGRVNIQYLIKAIEAGAEGVVLLTCPKGTCKYIEGNLRAEKRVRAVNSFLIESGFQQDTVKIIQPEADESTNQIIERINKACNAIIHFAQPGKIRV
jgi:coenzyme F420-reducing hydrogenase delta subunit